MLTRVPFLALPNVPPRLLADVHAWARLRRKSLDEAATELLRVGVDVTSARAQRQGAERQRPIEPCPDLACQARGKPFFAELFATTRRRDDEPDEDEE